MKSDRFTEWIMQLINRRTQGMSAEQARLVYGYSGGLVSIVVNVLLFAVKLVAGIAIGSISVIADAVHTGSDVLTSGIVMWGFGAARKPADSEHPFGHGRMEQIVTLIIAVLLVVVGWELASEAVMRCMHPPVVEGRPMVIVVLVCSAIIKEWLARFAFRISDHIAAVAMSADAWHHRTDMISTVLVILAISAAKFQLYVLDPLFGLLVAAYIIYIAGRLIVEATNYLLGKAVDPRTVSAIKEAAQGVAGVEGVHDIMVHDYGMHKAVSLHVEVNPFLDARSAHEIATAVERRVAERNACSSIVHIDLRDSMLVKETAAMRSIGRLLRQHPEIHNVHGVRMAAGPQGNSLRLHVMVPKTMDVGQAHALEHRFSRKLADMFQGYSINVHIEPCRDFCRRCRRSAERKAR